MSKRAYVSPVREAATAAKRARMLSAAIGYLREEKSIAGFSLEAVAKAAGVTRLTIYNQFGSRRGLLEAVFDEIANAGDLPRLRSAVAMADPEAGLDEIVAIFCSFWSGDPAIGRLHDAMALDPELAQGLLDRNDRRRPLVVRLVARLADDDVSSQARGEATDMIFALTSLAMFRLVAARQSEGAVLAMLQYAARSAIQRMLSTRAPRNSESGAGIWR